MARLQVLAGAGIEDHPVQRSPGLLDTGCDPGYLYRVVEVANGQQHLPGKVFSQRRETIRIASAQGNLVALLQQASCKCGTDTAACASQPATAHATLPLSHRIALPMTGTCS